jgi:hypothetical protein
MNDATKETGNFPQQDRPSTMTPPSAASPKRSSRRGSRSCNAEAEKNRNQNEDENDDDNEEYGHVAAHAIAAANNSARKVLRTQQSTPSSWADGGRQQRRQQQRWMIDDIQSYQSAPPPRTKTPTMSNVTMTTASYNKQKQQPSMADDVLSLPPVVNSNEDEVSKNSFKGWLAEGIMDVLNAAAGITLSTTGAVLSPPIELTKNVILPGVLAIVVDALDNITPPRVQDWFRIITSSVYYLFTNLKSTEQGIKFRKQMLLTLQTWAEAWSAPESRQVVVDGMAAGVKLADALQ